MSYFCDFCQVEHSSMSCFHPGRHQLTTMTDDYEALLERCMTLTAENNVLRDKIADFAGELHEGYDLILGDQYSVDRLESLFEDMIACSVKLRDPASEVQDQCESDSFITN